MAKSSADDEELRRACEAAIDASGTKQKVVLSIRVAKSRGMWGKSGKMGRNMAKPRVLAISSTRSISSPFFHNSHFFSFSLYLSMRRFVRFCLVRVVFMGSLSGELFTFDCWNSENSCRGGEFGILRMMSPPDSPNSSLQPSVQDPGIWRIWKAKDFILMVGFPEFK